MNDFLAKFGLPAVLSAIVSAAIVAVPLLFKVDERYAKDSDLKAAVLKLEASNIDLRHELAQSVGFQQAMVALIQAGKIKPTSFDAEQFLGGLIQVADRDVVVKPQAAASAASAPIKPMLVAPPRKQEKPINWKELSEGLVRQQQRLIQP